MIFKKAPEPKDPDDKKPVLLAIILLLGLVVAGLAQSVLGNSRTEVQQALTASSETQILPEAAARAPIGLQAAIENLAGGEPGKNGVLVRSVEEGWVVGYKGATTFSQGNLRRVWLGAALLDAVDHGELKLEQQVPLLRARENGQQSKARIGELLRRAVQANERAAQDHVLDGLMGPEGMAQWLGEKEIDEVAYGPSSRDMARLSERADASANANPPDGATPDGMAFGLSELFAGKLLSVNSAQLLLSFFGGQPAPAGRGDETGWDILRITGETAGSDTRPIAASGAALVRSPKGQRFVITVFADGPADPTGRRERLLNGAVSAIESSATR